MSAPPVKKACDACHRRKVRCTGGQPCKNCGQATLQCTYLAIPQKKGPKGSRAKVISEIRDTQQSVKPPPPPPTPPTTQQQQHQPQITAPPTRNSNHELERNPFDFNSPPISPSTYIRSNELINKQTVTSCVNFFFSHLYPTMPVFNQQKFTSLANDYQNSSPEVYCLVLSLCAFTMVQPGVNFDGTPLPLGFEDEPPSARIKHGQMLLKEVNRIRKSVDYVSSPSDYSMQTSFFLFCAYFTIDESTNQCWYYLREASTLAYILKMNEESYYRTGDARDSMYKRRFYWLLLVTERAFAMERHRPLSMLATVELPSLEDEPSEAPFMSGFLYLANLFRLIDDEFMALWNKAKAECSTSYLSQLQQQIVDALPRKLECTENQATDVRITQHWLRTMVWQLSISNGYLSSSTPDLSMTFKYPIQIAKDLVQDLQAMSLHSMEVHGVGLIEKLFDMSCTLSDVIACVPIDAETNGASHPPQEYLNQLLNLISRLRGGASRYVPLLMAKVAENIPNMANPLTHMPPSLDAFMDSNASTSSSPLQMVPSISQQGQSTPQSQSLASPAPQGPFPRIIAPPPFGDNHAPHPQGGLMFDAYSPSVDSPLTPPVPGMPFPFHGFQSTGQHLPRSVPLSSNDISMKYDNYNG